ncbi:DHH family phosphoesterase [Natrinema caseinilyticum]|uniref:DHH family phosphoesterase n=1 Tax=Natrinema caseinilyticum TaxID=2961570 RepID=UPI0020C2F113|nr:bifunctional oligoribonuclease/PAP phosphatase NrnA [Natrinema caseinilyticum]
MNETNQLRERFEACDSLAIVCHPNPDPDCIASALALERIGAESGVDDVQLFYCGEISHQQNRAFVNLLDVSIRHPSTDTSITNYQSLALVDHAEIDPSLPRTPDSRIEIIIDHHEVTDQSLAEFVDSRPDYGATATIMIEYLAELDIEPSSRLASALLFALHRERLDYVRHPTRREYHAASFVCPYADNETLDQLYGSAYTPATIDAISEAIARRRVQGSSLVTTVGRTTETDALPQAADYLLNLEGVDTVLVEGVVDDTVRISARSIDPRINVGDVLKRAFDDVGSAGGHQDMAGGRLRLGIFADSIADDDSLLETLFDDIARRFFDALNFDQNSA